jgi:hypothetical protein
VDLLRLQVLTLHSTNSHTSTLPHFGYAPYLFAFSSLILFATIHSVHTFRSLLLLIPECEQLYKNLTPHSFFARSADLSCIPHLFLAHFIHSSLISLIPLLEYEQSHAKNEGAAPLSNDTFQSLLTRNAEKYEDKDAFVSHSEDVKHTHKEIKVRNEMHCN